MYLSQIWIHESMTYSTSTTIGSAIPSWILRASNVALGSSTIAVIFLRIVIELTKGQEWDTPRQVTDNKILEVRAVRLNSGDILSQYLTTGEINYMCHKEKEDKAPNVARRREVGVLEGTYSGDEWRYTLELGYRQENSGGMSSGDRWR